ncbi:MAG: hypothetical protein HUJ53_09880 [Holdemanella sp.]|nr:hypothetical protein [Holdemanella sp.]
MPLPIYIFTGFLDSGKTSLIKNTLLDEQFNNGSRSLILRFEQGEDEYEESFLKKVNAFVEDFDSLDDCSLETMRKLDNQYWPDQVMVEWNGTWDIKTFLDAPLPEDWIIVQIITTIDASTFENYINNMRTFMFNIISTTDVIIFNRIEKDMKKNYLRTNVKSINNACQIVYESIDGDILEYTEEDLPFDLKSKEFKVDNNDYGLWYVDALENADKYVDKVVTIQGRVLKEPESKDPIYIFGRNAMVCCADDIQLYGYMVRSRDINALKDHAWIELKATMKAVFDPNFARNVPALIEESVTYMDAPDDELVYFS